MVHKKVSQRPASSINITPLIDILLVLLVIFMVITPIDSVGLDTVLPQEPPPGATVANDQAVVVHLDREGTVRINQQAMDITGLEGALREIFKTRGDRAIFVQADEQLLFNDVARLVDVVTGAGALKIGLMTK